MSEQTTGAEQAGTEEDPMTPFNDVERLIVDGGEGKLSNNEVLSGLLGSPMFFLTAEEVTDTTPQVQPLILEGPDGLPVLAVFTHPARVAQPFIDSAPFAVSITGGMAFEQADGIGIAINPGHPIGLVLDAENVKLIQSVLVKTDEATGTTEA